MNIKVTMEAFLPLTLLLLQGAIAHPARPFIPQCSETHKARNEYDITCILQAGQFLDYNDIRIHSSNNVDKMFNVTIDCAAGGLVELPWPFEATNVFSLQVNGCTTSGYFSERNALQRYSSELKYLSLIDVTHKITIKELHNMVSKMTETGSDYECGPENAFVKIFRNIQYMFPPPQGSVEELMMMDYLMSSDSMKNLVNTKRKCRYHHLNYLEESGSRSMSSVHFKILETSSEYPELKHYNLRNNSFTSVPEELRRLNIRFMPKLAYLDLSDNNVRTPDFTFDGVSTTPLVINLRRNKITNIDKTSLSQLVKNANILFDLRENPIVCSCEMLEYSNSLSRSIDNSTARDIYETLTCLDSRSMHVLVKDFKFKGCLY